MQKVSAEFAYLYEYEIDDHDDDIDITFKFPKTFEPKGMKIEHDKQANTLKVTIPNEIPIVCGKLFAPLESYTTAKSQNSFTISFEKEKPMKWPIFIQAPLDDDSIDPQSALLLFAKLKDSGDPNVHDLAQKLISFAIDSEYLPAILLGIQANAPPNGDQQSYLQMLYLAATKYEHPLSLFSLGCILLQNQQSAQEGFMMLQHAAQLGVGLAVSVMGKVLSPLSEIPFPAKDAKQALELLESVIKITDEPIALYEAAKLYDSGLGCEHADHEKAMEYYKRAKDKDPQVPPLPTPKTSSKVGDILKTSVIALTGAAALGGLAYSVYKIFNKKN